MKYLVASTVVVEKLAKLKDHVIGVTSKQIKNVAKSVLGAVQLGAVQWHPSNLIKEEDLG